jgi:hypothetical protein
MLGPKQMNSMPAPTGSFKGEFFCTHKGEWEPKLVGIYLVSFTSKHDLRTRKMAFTAASASSGDSPPDETRTTFTTEPVSFGHDDAFLLIFKARVKINMHGKPIEGTEMLLLSIGRLFVPS